MKKYLCALIVFSFFAVVSCQEKVDIEKEKEAIKAVLEEENQAFLNKDFDRFAATYIKDDKNIRISSNVSGYNYYKGWKELGALFEEYFQNNPEPSTDKYVRDNFTIKVYRDNAWVVNDETIYDPEGNVLFTLLVTKMLEKEDEAWKFTYMSVVNTSSYEEASGEDSEEAGEE